jgi:hypothetical protein
VAAKLSDPSAIKQEAEALRKRLEGTTDARLAGPYAQAYAAAAKAAISKQDKYPAAPWVEEILTLAGHPFITDVDPLLEALAPLAGKAFGSDTGKAVAWWMKDYKGNPANLWPQP